MKKSVRTFLMPVFAIIVIFGGAALNHYVVLEKENHGVNEIVTADSSGSYDSTAISSTLPLIIIDTKASCII